MTVLVSPSQFECLLFFPSCLIAVARPSRTMLNKNGGSGHPCPIPDLEGNVFSFCPLSMMFPVGFSYMALRYDPCITSLLSYFFLS